MNLIEQLNLIKNDMKTNLSFNPYRVIVRWAGGEDRTLGSGLDPERACHLFALLATPLEPKR